MVVGIGIDIVEIARIRRMMERWQEGIEQYERAIEIDGERLGPEVAERLQEARKRLRQTEPRP